MIPDPRRFSILLGLSGRVGVVREADVSGPSPGRRRKGEDVRRGVDVDVRLRPVEVAVEEAVVEFAETGGTLNIPRPPEPVVLVSGRELDKEVEVYGKDDLGARSAGGRGRLERRWRFPPCASAGSISLSLSLSPFPFPLTVPALFPLPLPSRSISPSPERRLVDMSVISVSRPVGRAGELKADGAKTRNVFSLELPP